MTRSTHPAHRRRDRREDHSPARSRPSRSPRPTSPGSTPSTRRCTPSCTSTARARSRGPRRRRRSAPRASSSARWPACRSRSRTSSPPRASRPPAARKILEGWLPPYDATVTARLQAADVVILGKTNMDEFAMGSSTENSAYGPTGNPWDLDRIPGGSGGGSAAALAAFEAPLAIGTDTGGSIRQPAAVTGTVGVKPTYGGVSRYGLVAFSSSLDQGGPCARTVLDAALLHEVIAGHDPLDSTSIDAPVPPVVEAARTARRRCRAARRRRQASSAARATRPACSSASTSAVELLKELGAEIVELSLPVLRPRAVRVLPDRAERVLLATSPASTPCATACGSATTARTPPRRSWRSPARPASAPRSSAASCSARTRSPPATTTRTTARRRRSARSSPATSRRRSSRSTCSSRRRRRPPRSRSASASTTRWRCTSPTSHHPDQPGRQRGHVGAVRSRPGGRAAGRAADHRPGPGRGRLYRVGAAFEAARDAERRRSADRSGCPLWRSQR